MEEELVRPIIIYSYNALIFKITLIIAAVIGLCTALIIIIYAII